MGSISPVPELQAFAAETPMETVFEALYRDGAVKIKGLVSPEGLAAIQGELQPHFDAKYKSDLLVFAKETKTICGVAGKSQAAVKAVMQNDMVKAALKDVLETTSKSWWGDLRNECVSPPLLSSFFAVRVGPGSARQGLHRDDQDHHATHTHGDPKETTKFGVITASRHSLVLILFDKNGVAANQKIVSKATCENGATEIVPGSHLWDDERKPRQDEVTYGEMDAGDALFLLGNTYHGAGGNTTENEQRAVIVSLFCKGMYRAEENQFLAVDRETVKGYPYEVQDLLGWKASAPYCGWYEFSHPSDLLREGAKGHEKDIF
jgi:ectoine hydroxylase-related dioxygenase (phytanoyl-CoA dioxygenase family)